MSNSANRRLKREGRTVPVYELRCPRCRRGKLLTQDEVAPMQKGLVPYCSDCLKEREVVQMRVTKFASGPPDLHV